VSAPEAWELTQEYEEKGKRLTEKEEHRLKKLGNILGDVLVSLKQDVIGNSEDSLVKTQITTLIDLYTREFDEILRKHRVGMVSEIKKLLKKLVDDLEKITN
jgi:hypothetical protein